MDKDEIRNEAKKIMDSFFETLGDVDTDSFGVKRPIQKRDTIVNTNDEDFRNRLLENAPHKTQDHIIAEKKKW